MIEDSDFIVVYLYKHKIFLGKDGYGRNCWKKYQTEVKILSETEKSYRIRYLQPTCNHKTGYITWVRKRKVVQEQVYKHTWTSGKEIIAGDINIFCQDLCVCDDCNVCPLRHYKDVGGRKKKEKV